MGKVLKFRMSPSKLLVPKLPQTNLHFLKKISITHDLLHLKL